MNKNMNPNPNLMLNQNPSLNLNYTKGSKNFTFMEMKSGGMTHAWRRGGE